jgi:integrase
MPRLSRKIRLGQIGNYWLSKNPARSGFKDAWCRTWYDSHAQQTRRTTLGTSDFKEASIALARWIFENEGDTTNTKPDQVLIVNILNAYWHQHAQKLSSAPTAMRGLAYWREFWKEGKVSNLTPREQLQFREWLAKKGISASGIDRILSDGRAALNRAVKWQELDKAPHIFGVQTAEDRRSREPLGRPILPAELALLIDAAKSRHILVYLMIASNTLARPGAILDLRREQFDELHGLLDLNPKQRRQTKKFRPILPVTPTLQPWLDSIKDPKHRYVSYNQAPVKSIKSAWKTLCETAGLDERVEPYSIRHGMAREMRKRQVPIEQISLFLGHQPKDSALTTSIYAPYEPTYCTEAVAAIENVMSEVRSHLKRTDIDQPTIDAATLAKVIGDKNRGGIGNQKREEIRFLILTGVPHAEIVNRTGVSSGTISLVRKELREAVPIYRNSSNSTR